MHLDEHHFAVHVRLFAEIGDFDDVDQPVQLLVHLLQDFVIPRGNQRNTRYRRIFRLGDTETLNIKTAGAKQTRNTPEDPKLVLHQHRKDVTVHRGMIRRHHGLT